MSVKTIALFLLSTLTVLGASWESLQKLNPGDTIAKDQPVLELETDKVNLEVPSPVAGVLTRIDHPDGADVKIGEILGVVDEAGAAAAAPAPAARAPRAAPAPAAAQEKSVPS